MRNGTRWLLGLVFFGAIFMAGIAHALPMASMTLLDPDIIVGENFQVQVEISGEGIDQGLLGFGFNVQPDSSLFSYSGYTLGPGFADVSDPLDPFNITGAAFPAIETDDVLLATLSFASLTEGTGLLEIFGDNMGCNFCGLMYEVDAFDIASSTSITVDPIPEPSTWLLMVTGFLGLIGMMHKRLKVK
ncbi:PEP-CTERM sorting domain-containing protein [Geoalkalibacter halelectricus]|uniref:PEP-CTERM sorting domain-containing protein n=1 Tax=Geoalkalibacter halelectricus TaxID=2847045 RepID=UPI003D1FBE5A